MTTLQLPPPYEIEIRLVPGTVLWTDFKEFWDSLRVDNVYPCHREVYFNGPATVYTAIVNLDDGPSGDEDFGSGGSTYTAYLCDANGETRFRDGHGVGRINGDLRLVVPSGNGNPDQLPQAAITSLSGFYLQIAEKYPWVPSGRD